MVIPTSRLPEKIQVLVTTEAAKRLRIAGALNRQPLGQVISELAEKHLPPAPAIVLVTFLHLNPNHRG